MAHELTIKDGVAEMAWAVTPPWHKFGQQVNPGASVEEWQKAAGLEWNIQRAPVQFTNGELRDYPDKHVLYRDDSNAPLSVVSSKYHVVQPGEVLEFFRDLAGAGGFTINTAGSLRGGCRIWALAEIGKTAKVVGDDAIGGFLLLATSCDGGLATTARFTTVRVVCANTLAMAEHDRLSHVTIPHNTKFDPAAVKSALGIAADRGVIECFRRLSWCYRTNLPHKFGKRIIMSYLASGYGYPNHARCDELDDLMRVFSVLDGKPEADHRRGIYTLMSGAMKERQTAAENDYISLKWYKKGSGHITFKRLDLVDKMNKILGKHYPNALPEEIR